MNGEHTMQSTVISDWKGYERHDFLVDGREALVVRPKIALDGNPWVWRAEFFDAFPAVDMAMLGRGWHLAYYRVSDLYGCPRSIRLMRGFQAAAEAAFRLSGRAVLFGFSRGGLYAFNYAAKYPDKVAALYLDAPVLDIRSWPGGLGAGSGSPAEWEDCLRHYGLTRETAQSFTGNPLDRIDRVAAAGIPVAVVAGDEDGLVPYAENGALLVARYGELGGTVLAIVKRGCGHHPHSLEDPAPVVEFLMREALRR
jgi:pimeloyl-ACP methyl ester carboxylesterase